MAFWSLTHQVCYENGQNKKSFIMYKKLDTLLLLSLYWFPSQRDESIPKNNYMFFCLSRGGRREGDLGKAE